MEQDIRWIQRFSNYKKAFKRLKNIVDAAKARELSEIEQAGMIKAFEFTLELSWKVMKDYLENMGITGIIGSKGAAREAFRNGLLYDGEVWMDMIEDRNLAAHTYSDEINNRLVPKIISVYYDAFKLFMEKMAELQEKENQSPYGLTERTLAILNSIFEKYAGLEKVILYGSRAKGSYKNGSDIDIALVTNAQFASDDLPRISGDFEESGIPYMVDVLEYGRLNNEELKSHIDRVGKILYSQRNNLEYK